MKSIKGYGKKPNATGSYLYTQLILIVVILVAVVGWVSNLMNVLQHNGDVTGMFVAQIVGLFIPPLGMILGFVYW